MIIEGKAGAIEVVFTPREGASHVVVLCHPHPLYGGSLHDGVLAHLEAAALAAGVSSLRFNFRGVGASDGAHDRGVGEVDDVLAACEWARREGGGLLLGGYSFGAAAALKAASVAGPAALLLVAPPPALMGDASIPSLPTRVIVGDSDPFADVDALRARFAPPESRLDVIEDCDHFFMDAAGALESLAREFFDDQAA